MNKVILTGNLCREIELKQTNGGKEVVGNCVAVKRDYKNANGEYESDFINIVIYGASATYLSKYASKGDRVEIVGRWNVRKYEDNNGTTQIINECVVESITALSKPKEDAQPTKKKSVMIDDLPF